MNAGALARVSWLVLVLAGVVAISLVDRSARVRSERAGELGSSITVLSLGGGVRGIADAGGQVVPLRDYGRIASGSTVADELLLAMAEPERIIALTRYGREHGARSHLYGARIALNGPGDVERLRRERVDLLLLHHYGPPAELVRARESGAQVFNLGDMRGWNSLESNMEVVGSLLGDPARGRALAAGLRRRLDAVAADIPLERRKRGLYASAYAGILLGGAANTSYHDVLTAAGLIDVAAARYSDWPHYDPEELFALDPDVIVTTEGSQAQLCRISGLARLRACAAAGGVIALPDALISNPGLGMLDAAELLRERVYGPIRVRR